MIRLSYRASCCAREQFSPNGRGYAGPDIEIPKGAVSNDADEERDPSDELIPNNPADDPAVSANTNALSSQLRLSITTIQGHKLQAASSSGIFVIDR